MVEYCGHSFKRHQIIMLCQLQCTIHHPLVHVSSKVICDNNFLDYNYVFQAASNLLQKYFIVKTTSYIKLYHTFNATTNVCITFMGGNNKRISMEINFICPFDDKNGPSLL